MDCTIGRWRGEKKSCTGWGCKRRGDGEREGGRVRERGGERWGGWREGEGRERGMGIIRGWMREEDVKESYRRKRWHARLRVTE